MQDIGLICKNKRRKERNKHSKHLLQERLRTQKAHIRPFDNQTSASCKILHLSVKSEIEKRRKDSNNSLRGRLRTHKAFIWPFDNQTSASCKILHLSVKIRDRQKGRNTVKIHYKNVSVLIKLIYVHLIIKLQSRARYCTCL